MTWIEISWNFFNISPFLWTATQVLRIQVAGVTNSPDARPDWGVSDSFCKELGAQTHTLMHGHPNVTSPSFSIPDLVASSFSLSPDPSRFGV